MSKRILVLFKNFDNAKCFADVLRLIGYDETFPFPTQRATIPSLVEMIYQGRYDCVYTSVDLQTILDEKGLELMRQLRQKSKKIGIMITTEFKTNNTIYAKLCKAHNATFLAPRMNSANKFSLIKQTILRSQFC